MSRMMPLVLFLMMANYIMGLELFPKNLTDPKVGELDAASSITSSNLLLSSHGSDATQVSSEIQPLVNDRNEINQTTVRIKMKEPGPQLGPFITGLMVLVALCLCLPLLVHCLCNLCCEEPTDAILRQDPPEMTVPGTQHHPLPPPPLATNELGSGAAPTDHRATADPLQSQPKPAFVRGSTTAYW